MGAHHLRNDGRFVRFSDGIVKRLNFYNYGNVVIVLEGRRDCINRRVYVRESGNDSVRCGLRDNG